MPDKTIEPAADVASSHTTGRIEIVVRVSGRRRWTVEQSWQSYVMRFGPDGSVRGGRASRGVGSGTIYTWWRQAKSGTELSAGPASGRICRSLDQRAALMLSAPSVEMSADARTTGQIGIELLSGVRTTVDGTVDADALSRVISLRRDDPAADIDADISG